MSVMIKGKCSDKETADYIMNGTKDRPSSPSQRQVRATYHRDRGKICPLLVVDVPDHYIVLLADNRGRTGQT